MKVRCVCNNGENLSQKTLDIGWTKQTKMGLKLDKTYLIYGIIFYKNIFEYLTVDEYNKSFWYPSEIFQIIDNKLSSLWYYIKYNKEDFINSCWGYYELVNKRNHHSDLIEREPKDIEIFNIRKKEMDLEFSDDSIKEKATLAETNWLMCPICIDAWETISIFGMVECPKCKTIMHNPKYKKL
ncbi:MAG: hypothetical protein K1060chlam5_00991 [Candidatus Anoxychlamydiales bacterium]|nr:hypothetical protein [Candidatus Anoxychlamydiales bacterium]